MYEYLILVRLQKRFRWVCLGSDYVFQPHRLYLEANSVIRLDLISFLFSALDYCFRFGVIILCVSHKHLVTIRVKRGAVHRRRTVLHCGRDLAKQRFVMLKKRQ